MKNMTLKKSRIWILSVLILSLLIVPVYAQNSVSKVTVTPATATASPGDSVSLTASTEVQIDPDTQEFIDKMTELKSLATAYMTENGISDNTSVYPAGMAEWLPWMYVRQFNSGYTTAMWGFTGGPVDTAFVTYVNTKSPSLNSYFASTTEVEGADLYHMAAATSAKLFNTSSVNLTVANLQSLGLNAMTAGVVVAVLGDGSTVNALKIMSEQQYDDLAGWAGDLQTFTEYINGLTGDYQQLAYTNMGQSGTTFDTLDVVADADAENLSNAILSGTSLPDVLDQYYTTDLSSGMNVRYTTFDGTTSSRVADYTSNTYTLPQSIMGMTSMQWPIYLMDGATIPSTVSTGVAGGYQMYINSQKPM